MVEIFTLFQQMILELQQIYPAINTQQIVDYFENRDAQRLLNEHRLSYIYNSKPEKKLQSLLPDFMDEWYQPAISLLWHVYMLLQENPIDNQPHLQTTFQQLISQIARLYPSLDLQRRLNDIRVEEEAAEEEAKKQDILDRAKFLPARSVDTRNAYEKLHNLLCQILDEPNRLTLDILSDIDWALREGGMGHYPQVGPVLQQLLAHLQKRYPEPIIQPIWPHPLHGRLNHKFYEDLNHLNLEKDLKLWTYIRNAKVTLAQYNRAIGAVEMLATARQALQAGVIGYQRDIQTLYDRIIDYLETTYPDLDLQPLLTEPENAIRKAKFVDDLMRVTEGKPQALAKIPLMALGDIKWRMAWGDVHLRFRPYIPKKIENPREILAEYGLDAMLTPADDPVLWATAVVEHWGIPRDPNLDLSECLFAIDIPLSDSNLYKTKEWRFYEHAGRIEAKPWTEADKDAERVQRIREGGSEPAVRRISIHCFGREQREAWVSGYSSDHGICVGERDIWIRRPDGSWVPDSEGSGRIG
ncbi:MAG: hypothetical protein R3C14_21310 [Caldilineaceae bacterium]